MDKKPKQELLFDTIQEPEEKKKNVTNFNSNISNTDEWWTPPEIIKSLGEFDLDPCAPHPSKRLWETAKESYYREINGLAQRWFGRVWCNPPYGQEVWTWIVRLADHGNGIALIFARTETKGFHSEIFNKANGIFFFKGRIQFYNNKGEKRENANAASCLCAYGKNNIEAIEKSGLQGKLIVLR